MNTEFKYALILGTHPEISMLELERVLESKHITYENLQQKQGVAFLTTPTPLDHEALMNQLGGMIKIAEVVGPYNEETLVDWLFEHMNTETKFNFGFSVYPIEPGVKTKKDWKTIHTLGLAIKKILKAQDISCRYVQSKEIVLSSVIVHKERLLKNGVEILLLKGKKGIIVAHTLAVQPFQSFSKRDYGRPQRDHKSGMLPTKVARMMLNIAAPTSDDTILDPFCGSGTVLQEALLLGFTKVIGADISEKSIQDTKENLSWLKLPEIPLHEHDVRSIDQILKKGSINCVVAEGYLGPPSPKNIAGVRKDMAALYKSTFGALQKIVAPGARVVIGLPAWKNEKEILPLSLEYTQKNAGFTPFHKPLYYARPNATVVRQIHFLEYK